MQGTLFVVGTPIGNLEDITLRAIKVFKKVDYILTERKSTTLKLLAKYNIHKPLVTYREDNHANVVKKIKKDLLAGKQIALVSEAGTPGFSDPGHKLLSELQSFSTIKVVPVPGPNSVATAISILPLESPKFVFMGFTPQRTKKFVKQLKALLPVCREFKLNLVYFESKERIQRDLQEIKRIDPNLEVCVLKELTKVHEFILCSSVGAVFAKFSDLPLQKGEFILVIKYQRNEQG